MLATAALTLPARAQVDEPKPIGLPRPDIANANGLEKALIELDRSGDTIVAEIGDRTVTWGDVADAIRALPRVASGIPFQDLYRATLIQVMQTKALDVRAEAVNLDKVPEVRRRMKNAADDALAGEFLRRSMAINVAPKALHIIYDGVVAGKPGPEEVQLRVLVTDTEDLATGLVTRLKRGEAFAELARQYSKDATGKNGGELGWVKRELLEPELGAVAFSMAVGETTAYPIRIGNLWFILQVEARRQTAAPTFEQAEYDLSQDVMHAGVAELRQKALQGAPIKYYGLTGKKPDKKK